MKDFSVSPAITRDGDGGHRQADGLGDKGHGAAGAGIDLQHIDLVALDGVLHIHQAPDIQRHRHGDGLALDLGDDVGLDSVCGGSEQALVAGMHAGFLDMLHDAGDEDIAVVVADRIHIHFGGAVEEAVDQHRIVAGDAEQFARLPPAPSAAASSDTTTMPRPPST